MVHSSPGHARGYIQNSNTPLPTALHLDTMLPMPAVCIYFQVHQPYRLRRYSVFDTDRHYFDDHKNAEILRKVAQKCYLPANKMLLETIKQHDGRFRVAFSISGTALEQFAQNAPEVLDSFKALANTGSVEFLQETFYHSLAFMYSRDEFRTQVDQHRARIKELFGHEPRVFRNTELIYNNDLAHFVSHMGYEGILAEGADQILGTRSPNFVYRPPHAPRIKLLLKNYRLSDDIAFRFSNRRFRGSNGPLTAENIRQVGQPDQWQRPVLQPFHGLRNHRRASMGGDRHLRFHPPHAR